MAPSSHPAATSPMEWTPRYKREKPMSTVRSTASSQRQLSGPDPCQPQPERCGVLRMPRRKTERRLGGERLHARIAPIGPGRVAGQLDHAGLGHGDGQQAPQPEPHVGVYVPIDRTNNRHIERSIAQKGEERAWAQPARPPGSGSPAPTPPNTVYRSARARLVHLHPPLS